MSGPETCLTILDLQSGLPSYKESLYLKGIITNRPRRLAQSAATDGYTLYLEDDTGHIPCLLKAEDLDVTLLTCGPVYVRSWNLVRGAVDVTAGGPWLEVLEVDAGLRQPTLQATKVLAAVSVKTASAAQNNRDKLLTQDFNVFGVIENISEISRVKYDNVFVVTLKDTQCEHFIHILAKRAEFVHWHWFLHPGEKYVFERLRPTTLYKGDAGRESRIFAFTAQARLHHHHQVEIHELDSQKILRDVGLPAPVSPVTREFFPNKLITYEGTITDQPTTTNHPYILDGQTGMYLLFRLHASKLRALRIGARIRVCNAHHKTATKKPQTRLYCCHISSIEVLSFQESGRSDNSTQIYEAVARTIVPSSGLGSLADLHDAISAEDILREKFTSSLLQSRHVGNLVSDCWKQRRGVNHRGSSRSAVMEFLHHHLRGCLVSKQQKQNDPSMFVTIKQVQDWGERESKAATSDGDVLLANMTVSMVSQGVNQSSRDPGYWSYSTTDTSHSPCSNWILCGLLSTNKSTNNICLKDDRGTIDCVIGPILSIDDLQGHRDQCSSSQHLSASGKMDRITNYTHTYMCTHALGQLVFIKDFQIVVETFTYPEYQKHGFDGAGNGRNQIQTKLYLMCSMSDVYSHRGPDLKCEHTEFHARNPRETPELFGSCDRDKAGNSVSDSDQSLAYSTVQPSPVSRNICAATKTKKHVTYCHKFLLLHKDGLHVHKRLQKGVSLAFFASIRTIGECYLGADNQTDSTPQAKKPRLHGTSISRNNPKEYALYFCAESARWFPILHPGSLYVLKKTVTAGRQTGVFTNECAASNVTKAVNSASAMPCIVVRDGMEIVSHKLLIADLLTEVPGVPSDDGRAEQYPRLHHFLSVSTIIDESIHLGAHDIHLIATVSERFTEKSKYSFNADIGQKLDEENLRLGVSLPRSRSLIIVLADVVHRGTSIHLYFSSDNLSYPLGLLPGNTVRFYRLEKRISRSGWPYLYYTVASSCWVTHFTSTHGTKPTTIGDSVTDNAVVGRPRPSARGSYTLLGNLQFMPLSSKSKSYCISCHIQHIIKLSLTATCSQCGSVWRGTGCISERCDNSAAPTIIPKISCSVDDGSGTAMVFFNTNATTAALLSLTDDEWTAVKAEVTRLGSIHIQHLQQGGVQGQCEPIHTFLHQLMNSPAVKRGVCLLVKRYTCIQLHTGGEKYSSIHHIQAKGFKKENVDIGKSFPAVQTRKLPWLHLTALNCQESKYSQLIDV